MAAKCCDDGLPIFAPRAEPPDERTLPKAMKSVSREPIKRSAWLIAIILTVGCAKVLAVREIPGIVVGEPSFFRTIEAHTDAPIVAGNRIEVLLNGDETFPAMLRDIKAAKWTITFAQYLFEPGTLATEFAQAFAERCRVGVEVNILLDDHGSAGDLGCRFTRALSNVHLVHVEPAV